MGNETSSGPERPRVRKKMSHMCPYTRAMTPVDGASVALQGTRWGKAYFSGGDHCYLGTRPNTLQLKRPGRIQRIMHDLRTFH